MTKLSILIISILLSCDSITFSEENEPSLMYELEIIADLFEEQGLTWNPENKPFTLTFSDMEVWGQYEHTSAYFHIKINPDSPDYLITLLHEIGHLNGLQHNQGVIMTYGNLSILSAVWPWNKDQYLKEYFDLIKKVRK